MKLPPIEHIGIAVKDAEAVAQFYTSLLGLERIETEVVESMKLKIIKLRSQNVTIELLEPQAGEEVVANFIQKRGEGLHHLCFETDDVEQASEELQQKGYKPLWDKPRPGSGHRLVQFLHPVQTYGVLIELNQKPKKS